jgi:hypothetical protein
MASTNGLQGAPSNLTNTIDGLIPTAGAGGDPSTTGDYLNRIVPTTGVAAQISVAPTTGIFELLTSDGTANFEFTDTYCQMTVNQTGTLKLFTIYEAYNDFAMVETGAYYYPLEDTYFPAQVNSVPLLIQNSVYGDVTGVGIRAIVNPSWEQLRIFNGAQTFTKTFTSVVCDQNTNRTNWMTSNVINAHQLTEPPAYSTGVNFYTTPEYISIIPTTTQNCYINESATAETNSSVLYIADNGTHDDYIDPIWNKTVIRNGCSIDVINMDANNPIEFRNTDLIGGYRLLADIREVVVGGLRSSPWTFYDGVNFQTKWQDDIPPYSNCRFMNGNQAPTVTGDINSFMDIKVDAYSTLFYFSPTVSDYRTDPPTNLIMKFEPGVVTAYNMNVVGTLKVNNADYRTSQNINIDNDDYNFNDDPRTRVPLLQNGYLFSATDITVSRTITLPNADYIASNIPADNTTFQFSVGFNLQANLAYSISVALGTNCNFVDYVTKASSFADVVILPFQYYRFTVYLGTATTPTALTYATITYERMS